MSDPTYWTPNQIGTASAVTTVPGSTPKYGLAYDLGTAQWVSADQFRQFARDSVAQTQQVELQQALAEESPSGHDLELEKAQNYQDTGLASADDATWYQKAGGFLKNAFMEPSRVVRGELDDNADTFDEYTKKGGLLTEDEFNSFDEQTRSYLVNAARVGSNFSAAASAPGLKQGLEAISYGYRGATTAGLMLDQNLAGRGGDATNVFKTITDPSWWSQDKWGQAWRASQDRSLGNTIVDAVLDPYISQDRLADWRKHSSIYQLTSAGSEFGVGWYADPTVLLSKGAGDAARLARNELPLNESGSAYKATTQALQREQITVRGPMAVYGKARAAKIQKSWNGVIDYARDPNVSFDEFSRLPMWSKRQVDGQAGAFAVHWAANSGSDELLDLTQQLLHGDPKAYEKLASLKAETPEALQKFAPGAQTFIDAIDATKTKIGSLQSELDDLAKTDSQGFWYDWQTQRAVENKTADLEQATNALNGYEGYGAWLDSVGTDAGDKALPMISRVGVPVSRSLPSHHTFMDNQFGWMHTVREMPRSLYIQKANTVSMHDINSGVMSLQRQAEQFDHLFGYRNPDALDSALQSWHTAATGTERAEVIRQYEQTHLINAAAHRFDVDPGVVKVIYDKATSEQNKLFQGILSGDSTAYSAAPSVAGRLANGDESIKLLNRSEDGKYVTFELVDGMHRTTTTVPIEALTEKPLGPIDPTQIANYYNPMDTRRFYLELKRNSDLLDAMNKSGLSKGAARTSDVLMEQVDHWGQKFNNLWKPLTLFRLGWPVRVLMDEGLRGMAVLGPLTWLNTYGGDYLAAARNTLTYPLRTTGVAKRFGVNRNLNIGDGPVMHAVRQSPDSFQRDIAVREAPHVPEAFVPRVDRERYLGIAEHIGNYTEFQRLSNRIKATGVRGKGVLPKEPYHPITRALKDGKGDSPRVFDPVTGRPVNTGFVVPLPHTGAEFKTQADAIRWYGQNADLFGSSGHRIVVNPDGSAVVGRWFNGQRRKMSQDFLAHIDGSYGHDLKTGERYLSEIEDDVVAHKRLLDEAHTAEKAHLANGELRRQEVLAEGLNPELVDLDFQIDSPLSAAYRKISDLKQTGRGVLVTRTADGKVVNYDDAYKGHDGELFQSYTSANPAIDVLSEGHGRALSMNRRRAVGYKTYRAPDLNDPKVLKAGTDENAKAVEYYQRWADMVNDQLGSSPIWSRMLHGWSDEKLVNWLGTPQGAAVRREVESMGKMPELWINEARAKANYYLPNPLLRRLLAKGRIKPSDLRRHVPTDRLPDVFGPDLESLNSGTRINKAFSNIRDRMWNILGTVPIDRLSRHPFAKAMFDMKMRALINSTDSKWLTEETVARMRAQSHRFAMGQVKRHLWDLTDSTNFTDALRFMAPFWGAQQEAIVKWGRIILDRPETLARFMVGQHAAYNNFAFIDAEGNPVDRKGMFYHPTDRVVMQIPGFMKHGPLGKALATIGEVGIPLSSANVVLQGEYPLFPSAGPLVTIPADKFLRTFSDTYGSEYSGQGWYKWLFPIGQPKHGAHGGISEAASPTGWQGVLDQVSPGWLKRITDYSGNEDDPANANLFIQVGREMEMDARAKGLKPGDPGYPTEKDIAKQTKWLSWLRVATSLVSPVQVDYRPKHQFLIDAWHQFQKDNGPDSFDKFVDKYGLAAAHYTTSSSSTEFNVPPTVKGIESYSANKGLISQYPQWGGAIVSPDSFDDAFSDPVYNAQFQITPTPGDSTTLRETSSPKERLAKADASAGWYEYRKFDAALNAELYARGLHSIQQVGAEDLAQLKHAFTSDLATRYPAWRDDYDTQTNDIYTRVGELEKFAFLPEFENRPDFQGVRHYLHIRDQVASELDRYAAESGGSRSLQAQENATLATWFYSQVGQLVQANPAFAEFYSRYLSADTLEQGSG